MNTEKTKPEINNNSFNHNGRKYHYFFNHQKTNFQYCCSWKAMRSLVTIIAKKHPELELYSKKGFNPISVILDNQDINIDVYVVISLNKYFEVANKFQKDIISVFKNILEIKPNNINIILYKK